MALVWTATAGRGVCVVGRVYRALPLVCTHRRFLSTARFADLLMIYGRVFEPLR